MCKNDLPIFEYEEIREDLLIAINEFYVNDFELLLREVNEVCITSHIFHYFAMKFSEKYCGYNIDPEYNRNGFGCKYYYEDHYAKPDLIIHRRNCNKYNLLYAEFKTHRLQHDAHDQEKILRFISDEFGQENGKKVKPYRFRFGVSVLLNQNSVDLLWYKSGQVIAHNKYKISKKGLEETS
jgi:hypothetical protein